MELLSYTADDITPAFIARHRRWHGGILFRGLTSGSHWQTAPLNTYCRVEILLTNRRFTGLPTDVHHVINSQIIGRIEPVSTATAWRVWWLYYGNGGPMPTSDDIKLPHPITSIKILHDSTKVIINDECLVWLPVASQLGLI